MSRVIAWRRFIRVLIEDDANRPLDAFAFLPSPETADAMQRYRLMARAEGTSLSLYYRVFPQLAPPLRSAITNRVRLSFAMTLREQDFFQRHHPDLNAAAGASLHLDNLDGAGAILADGASLSAGAVVGVADAVQVARRRVPVSVGLAPPPTHVRAVNVQTGLPIIDTRPNPPVPVQVAVQPAPGASQFAAILDIPPSAGPLVRVRQAPAGALNRRAYADDWTSETGAAGVLDLFWENAQDTVPAGPGQVYRIVFARR